MRVPHRGACVVGRQFAARSDSKGAQSRAIRQGGSCSRAPYDGAAGPGGALSAIQLHGGMGKTDALPVGHYFKRLTMIQATLGNTNHHVAAFAALPQAA
jgi:hypothetical protein